MNAPLMRRAGWDTTDSVASPATREVLLCVEGVHRAWLIFTIMGKLRDADTILSERLRRRDATTRPELYDSYGDRLYGFVVNVVDRDHGIAEDIVQDVWLTALTGIDTCEDQSCPYAWHCGIALHKVQDHRRQKGATATVVMAISTKGGEGAPTGTASPFLCVPPNVP